MTTDADQLARAFKALSNPNRLRIYQEVLLRQRHDVGPDTDSGCVIYDFINALNIGAPTISHHVKELVNAGLIRVERNGKYLTCYLNEDMRERLAGFLGGERGADAVDERLGVSAP
ncbi:metalloregulator ArsR/SmtB family transcription factor [Marinobacteraceae bacterium S3BR75-40.1]